jgi:amino acid efflux transporter
VPRHYLNMKNAKIGALTLSGLTIAPILGSGILILPPIIYRLVQEWAIYAWLAIIIIGFLFAYVCGSLSIRFPGDGGITNAVGHAFGRYTKQLASIYLIIGVVFGAAAVLMTAADYVSKLNYMSATVSGYVLLAICFGCSLKNLSFLGKIIFIVSLVSVVVLSLGGVAALISYRQPFLIRGAFAPQAFGYSLLLLFWTILGWEIIGNYSAEVRDPRKTITRSIIVSAVIIAVIDIIIVAALQWTDTPRYWHGDITITTIIYPVFRGLSNGVMAVITLLLCCSTYLFYVGGIARLMAGLAEDKVLPAWLSLRSQRNVPIRAVIVIGALHLAVLGSMQYGYLTVEKLVAFANGFFLGHVLLGIGSAVWLGEQVYIRICGCILGVIFLTMLFCFASKTSLTVICVMAALFVLRQVKHNKDAELRPT